MVIFGFGEVIGGFIHGLVIDRIGSKKTVFLNLIIILIMMVLTIESLN